MKALLRILLLTICSVSFLPVVHAQEEEFSSALDSARAAEDSKADTVIYSARYIRYTTLAMMKQGTFTYQIDTLHKNFQYYNPQNQPRNPSIHLGSYGLATRDLLFVPNKTIGFQPGYHSLDRFLYQPDSIKYYRARAPFSELYNVGFFFDDQILRAKVTQNITPRLNIGGEFHAARADGYYINQRYNDIKSALFAWYESSDHRYNLLTNVVFNRLTSTENGSVLNDTLFRDSDRGPSDSESTRLRGTGDERPRHTWRDNSFFLRQSLFLGRLDTINAGKPEQQILPTNRMSHSLNVRFRNFQFYKNEEDVNNAFPFGDNVLTQDTTKVTTITNDFGYSFYLRGKSLAFIKNEVKLDLGYQHDMHWYQDRGYSTFLQNSMLKAGVGYRFSDRVSITGDLNQIVQGANFGDYLYEAKADILLSNAIGRVVLGAYIQNKSPEWTFQRVNYTYHQWEHDFEKIKTTNFSFAYENPSLGFSGKAEYFLIANHLYFREIDNPPPMDARLLRVIEPAQLGNNINLLKVTVGQNFRLGKFHLDNYVVYQQSDYNAVLAIPELYTWHSLYYNGLLYKIVDFNLGFDVRFNTPFRTPSYAINIGQFYNDNAGIEFSTYPIMDVWATATLKRANLFLSYNFINQFVWPAGYYTVRRYPMNNANLRVGISWKFYD
ncbi:putative porin [Parapedobacter sp. ISTM3]|uniref:Putative porin n=1 Tax=Parapedobacter luteus TaxID=623280 RepID=A0A1T5DDZ2_9SPHI|nr:MULTISPECIES: putative porin [Parapedobacter]MBK1438400.1 putative porin [Parapedobacter sp. ISTM3]SKB69886.1 Putative porin [Parapedobacter luteus]